MASGSDDFDDLNFDEFTEDDFAHIDRTIALVEAGSESRTPDAAGGPAVIIEIEPSAQEINAEGVSVEMPRLSPYAQFRAWNNVLSVSDLVSPAWYALSLWKAASFR